MNEIDECWMCRMHGQTAPGTVRTLGIGESSLTIALCTLHAFDIEMLAGERYDAVPMTIAEEVSICIRNIQVRA
jgi:hypothetical protein